MAKKGTVTMILAGGGTGGHVYPALAVAEALREAAGDDAEKLRLLYLGTRKGLEADLAPRAGLEFRPVSAGAVRGRCPAGVARSLFALALGTVQAWRQIGKSGADAVFATGGYASVPAGVAARLRRRPLVVYLPDVRPGWAVKFLSRVATRLATSSEQALNELPRRKTTVVGYPVRSDFWHISKAEARSRLGLSDSLPVLLVSGASQGARSLNKAVAANIEALTDICTVVHVTGPADELWMLCVRGNLAPEKHSRYQVYPYLHNLPLAMLAADLAVMRSGASVLGELPAARLPAILVPYPHAGAHQRANAEYLQSKGAAVIVEDDRLDGFLSYVTELLEAPERMESMSAAMAGLAHPDAARDLARMLLEVAK